MVCCHTDDQEYNLNIDVFLSFCLLEVSLQYILYKALVKISRLVFKNVCSHHIVVFDLDDVCCTTTLLD